MEMEKVKEMPLSNRGLSEDLLKLVEKFEKMKEGEVVKLSEKGRSGTSLKSTARSAARRVPSASFTIRVMEDFVYVRKDKDLIPEKEEGK